MKKIVLFVVVLLSIYSEATTVTGTLQDPAGQVLANARVRIEFAPRNSSESSNTTIPPVELTTDANGFFSTTLTGNNTITPINSTYTFNICPNATVPCSIVKGVSISGTSQDVSAFLNAGIQQISVSPQAIIPKAYNNTELDITSLDLFGALYWNSSNKTLRLWDGSTWNAVPSINSTLTANIIGDSISATCFDGCNNRWENQVAASRGWNINVLARSGDALFDQAAFAYGLNVVKGQRNFMLLGQNDGGSAIGTQARKDFSIGAMEAMQATLTIPNNLRIDANAGVATGTWTPSPFYAGGLQSSTAASNISFTLNGSDVMISVHKTTTTTASWQVNVDGVTYGPFDAVTPYVPINGATNSPHLFHIANLPKTTHTAIITLISGGPLYVDYAASTVPAGQGAYLVQGTPYNTNPGPETIFRDYETLIRTSASNLQQAGLSIAIADVRAACTSKTGTQLCTDHGDGIHPGLVGDGIIATAFMNAMQVFADPRPPNDERFGAYRRGQFLGLGPFQTTNFWSGPDIRDGGGIITYGQYSIGGLSNAVGANQGGIDEIIGGSKYPDQASVANICKYTWALWGSGGGSGSARLYQFCANGNFILGNVWGLVTANQLELRNGILAQTFVVNHTYTDTSNFEQLMMDWGGTSGGLRIFLNKAGTGVNRVIQIGTDAVKWEWATGGRSVFRTIADGGSDIGDSTHRPDVIWAKTSINHPVSTPASSTSTCTQGAIWSDASFMYVCTATNVIKRVSLTAF